MKTAAIASNLTSVEYDLALIDADHGPELLIEELLPAVFDVFRESDPVATADTFPALFARSSSGREEESARPCGGALLR